jgi:hypothetical protein
MINRSIETPISQSDTWAKIQTGRADALDRSDKPILYALIRHLEARTPHYFGTAMELAALAAQPDSEIPFTDEERRNYAEMRANPALARQFFNVLSASLQWTEESYRGAGMTIIRTKKPMRSSTTPVLVAQAPAHPAMRLPLPGMVPFNYYLALNPTTVVNLVLADFNDAFMNVEQGDDFRRDLNRHFVGQFGHFPHGHIITDSAELVEDMAWAHYGLLKDGSRKLVFHRPADWASSIGGVGGASEKVS